MASANGPTWHFLNPSQYQDHDSSPPGSRSTNKLLVLPGTDIWRPVPSTDTFTAPFQYTAVQFSSFRRARVTVSAAWKTQYDQGGLMIVFPRAKGVEHGTDKEKVKGARWIKAGIEFFEGAPQLGVVAADNVSDWSLSPLGGSGGSSATIEIAAVAGGAWVYVLEGERGATKRRTLREVKWAGLDGEEKEKEVLIGIYGAKPTPDNGEEGKELLVEFNGLEIETEGGTIS